LGQQAAKLDDAGAAVQEVQSDPLLLRLRNTDVETWAVMMSIGTG